MFPYLIYVLPIQNVVKRHEVGKHGFADDTQNYVFLIGQILIPFMRKNNS